MNETEKLINDQSEVDDTTQDYLDTIKNLKQNSVDKAQYEALRAENKKLLDSIVNGRFEEKEVREVELVPTEDDIKKLRQELFSQDNEMNNLTYVSKALELREALMKTGSADPFIPIGKQITPTREDIEIADKVATVYKECIEYAQGDSEAFTNELMRRTKDFRLVR